MSNPDTDLPRRHRADDDLEALASGSFSALRTPNGAADLLDGAADADRPSFTIDGEGDEEDALPASDPSAARGHKKGQDPDGEGEREPSSIAAAMAAASGEPKSGKWGAKEAVLAERTSKIMSDYQAYLQEIETEFPTNEESEETDRAIAYIEEVKGAYRESFQGIGGFPRSIARDGDDVVSTLASEGGASMRRNWKYGGEGDDVGPEAAYEEDFENQMLIRGQKYTHPWLHSKRVRRGVCLLVVACVVIGTVAGITSAVTKSNKNKNLPDWEQELADIEREEKEKRLQDSKYYEAAAQKYQPIWFGRSNGWTGKSYLEALEFCGESGDRLPCPFKGLCPLGRGTIPIGGLKEKGSWAPIMDSPNDWVMIGPDESCTKYSELHDELPSWGLNGEGDEDITRHIVCCLNVEETPADAAPTATENVLDSDEANQEISMTYEQAAITFKPQWYGRDKGWVGQTYDQAVEFCNAKDSYMLCAYEVICPMGRGECPSKTSHLFILLVSILRPCADLDLLNVICCRHLFHFHNRNETAW